MLRLQGVNPMNMKTSQKPTNEEIRHYVRQRYGAIAEESGTGCGCTATGCCPSLAAGPTYGEQLGYAAADQAAAPAGADLGLGCGNPLAMASIQAGETVLDLGSGAGFDCFLAARQLGGTGRVIGVDMTPAMVEKARAHAARSGWSNVEFRLGEIEALPVADASVDLILSNCVINLSPEKDRVFREAFRVLRPGGRLAVADIVATRPLPDEIRTKLESIGACIGGATLVDELRGLMTAAGFARVQVVPRETSRELIREWTDDARTGDFVVSAFITAYKD